MRFLGIKKSYDRCMGTEPRAVDQTERNPASHGAGYGACDSVPVDACPAGKVNLAGQASVVARRDQTSRPRAMRTRFYM